jgi:hypothetical protein
MVALKWSLYKYVVIFFRLFLMLDRGPNKVHMGGDHCRLTISYVVFHCCFWHHVDEHFQNFENLSGT